MSDLDSLGNLSAAQLRALAPLLASGSIQEAANAAGVTLRTLRVGSRRPSFRMRESARASFREAHSLLLAAGLEAVQTLWTALRTGSPAGRIRAARVLLELGLKVADTEVDERLERLEEAWRAAGGTEPPGLRILSS